MVLAVLLSKCDLRLYTESRERAIVPSYTIYLQPSAERDFRKKIPAEAQLRIRAAIDALAENPRPHGCTKLEGSASLWRIRIGDYRVTYTISDKEREVYVVNIADRKEAYRRH